MSARDDLLRAFSPLHALDAWNAGVIEQAVDEILAKHAHELAEKIRTAPLPEDGHYNRADAAAVIDPEVP